MLHNLENNNDYGKYVSLGISQASAIEYLDEEMLRQQNQQTFPNFSQNLPQNDATNACMFLSLAIAYTMVDGTTAASSDSSEQWHHTYIHTYGLFRHG